MRALCECILVEASCTSRVSNPPLPALPSLQSLDTRRQGLETYLQGLIEVRALRPLIAQFLALSESDVFGESRAKRAANPAALSAQGSSGVTNTALSAEERTAIDRRHARGLSNPELIDGLDMHRDSDAGQVALPSTFAMVTESGETYIVTGAQIEDDRDKRNEVKEMTSSGLQLVSQKFAQRGNTSEAAEKARRDKEEFLRVRKCDQPPDPTPSQPFG